MSAGAVIAPAAPRRITVASLPATHPYVRHLADPDRTDAVVRLPEPFRGGPPGASWYPSPMLDGAWIDANADRFDLLHVHFGFDHLPAARLGDALRALRRRGRPLVFTVHDLRNPHHADPGAHDHALDALVRAADGLVTLTPGAAGHIARRWGRHAVVAPHPHIVPPRLLDAPRRPRDGYTVGVHLKNMRPNMVAMPVVRAALEGVVRIGPRARLLVDVHDRLATPGDPLHAPALVAALARLARDPQVRVRIGPYRDDEALWRYLAELDASILPYRFGTHSGWLEACHDLGTAVIAPSCGFYAEQRPVTGFDASTDAAVARTLPAAVVAAHAGGPPRRPGQAGRRTERSALARVHREVYERALGWA